MQTLIKQFAKNTESKTKLFERNRIFLKLNKSSGSFQKYYQTQTVFYQSMTFLETFLISRCF